MVDSRGTRGAAAVRSALKSLEIPRIESFHPSVGTAKPPTGRCSCNRTHWHPGDTPNDAIPWSCLKCWNHWWERNGVEIDGPPFQPYGEVLAAGGLLTQLPLEKLATETRERNATASLVPQFAWWRLPQFNPMAGAQPGSRELPWITRPHEMVEAEAEHLELLFRRSFESGSMDALFDYVYLVRPAFEAPWVGKQITAWRAANTAESRKHLARVFKEALDTRGRRATAWLRIQQDLEVLLFIAANSEPLITEFNETTIKLEAVLATAAEEYGVKHATAKKIWTEYKPFVESVCPTWFVTYAAAVEWLSACVPRSR